MIKEIYEALIEAGASNPKAEQAATALANYDTRFNSIDLKLEQVRSELTVSIEHVRGEQMVIRWIASFNLAFVLAILWRTFV